MRKIIFLSLTASLVYFLLSFSDKDNVIKACDKSPDIMSCRESKVIGILERDGPTAAFEEIEKIKIEDPKFGPSCHSFAHVVGVGAYNLFLKGKDVFAEPLSSCDYGYYHGLMMELTMHGRGSGADFAFAKDYCEKLRASSPQNHNLTDQCYHGIGHGLPLYYSSLDDAQKIIIKSMDTCTEEFGNNINCKIGVFGGISALFVGDHDVYLKNNEIADLFAVCRPQKNDLRGDCYKMMTPALLHLVNDNPEDAIFYSLKYIKAQSDLESIADPIGAAITTYRYDIKATDVKRICGKFAARAAGECIKGYARAMADAMVITDFDSQVFGFCRSGEFTETERAACETGAKEAL